MAQTPTDSRSNSNIEGTTLTSPPSEGSTVSGPAAPANTVIHTMGNQIPNPDTIAARLGNLSMAPTPAPNTETQSAPAALDSHTQREDPAHELYPEATTWRAMAEEDVENALKRLAMAAKDEHERDPSKTVKQYYSEALAKIIKDGEIEFDVSCMEES